MDENQLLTSPKFYKFEVFATEEEAKNFIKNWDTSLGQLSAICHSGKGYYIALPNVVSKGAEAAFLKTEELLKTNVSLGFEWVVGRTWFDCH